MKFLGTLPLIMPSVALAAAQNAPPLTRLGPLADRILFLLALWVLILTLVIILRWKISLADSLFRMMPPDKKETGGNSQREGSARVPSQPEND